MHHGITEYSLKCRYCVCDPEGSSGEFQMPSVYFERSEGHALAMDKGFDETKNSNRFSNKISFPAA